MPLLSVDTLSVEYYRAGKVIHALRDVSLSVDEGEMMALVGESGSGKSTLALSILGLISPDEGRITKGHINFNGLELLENSNIQWQSLRGKDIAMVFQDPFSSLNPVFTAGDQLREAVRAHNPSLAESEVAERLTAALREVQFTDTERIANSYPHQLSGGQRQRVMIAMAIINRPRLLIADEPTTALDVTIQKEILDLLDKIKKELSITVILITHNLPLAFERSQHVAVMYAGEIVESNTTENIFKGPKHPYTKALIKSIPRLNDRTSGHFLLSGQIPNLTDLGAGCAFMPRCAEAQSDCAASAPLACASPGGMVKCFLYRSLPKGR